jgi:1,4-dihydroxy-6-naphthoate synthase
MQACSTALRESISYAHDHTEEALEYAMRYGRGIDRENCLRFIRMYVSDSSIALEDQGREALSRLYQEGFALGLLGRIPPLDFVV